MITDLTYLNNMSGGSPEIIREMIGIFNEQANDYIRDFKKHLEEKDYHALSKLAHKAKSSISIMGMLQQAAELKELELLAKESKDAHLYPAYVERFIDNCTKAIIELNEVVTKL